MYGLFNGTRHGRKDRRNRGHSSKRSWLARKRNGSMGPKQ
nr:hypothetical protein BRACLTYN_BRACLTYN_CDS_0008 [Microvirus sp.]